MRRNNHNKKQRKQSTMSNNKYVFRYLNVRGLGDATRLLLELSETPYEEERFTWDEWQNSIKEEYQQKGITTFGQVPVLSVNDSLHLSQSNTILRYLARVTNRYGKTIEDQAQVDTVIDAVGDWRGTFHKLITSADFQEALVDYRPTMLVRWLTNFERLLERRYKGTTPDKIFFVGNDWTVADVVVFDALETMNRIESNVVTKYPLLHKFHQQFSQEPALERYISSDRRVHELTIPTFGKL
jgi:glutathione S-transferase